MSDDIGRDLIATLENIRAEMESTNNRLGALIDLLLSWDREFTTADGRKLHQMQTIARVYSADSR